MYLEAGAGKRRGVLVATAFFAPSYDVLLFR